MVNLRMYLSCTFSFSAIRTNSLVVHYWNKLQRRDETRREEQRWIKCLMNVFCSRLLARQLNLLYISSEKRHSNIWYSYFLPSDWNFPQRLQISQESPSTILSDCYRKIIQYYFHSLTELSWLAEATIPVRGDCAREAIIFSCAGTVMLLFSTMFHNSKAYKWRKTKERSVRCEATSALFGSWEHATTRTDIAGAKHSLMNKWKLRKEASHPKRKKI